MSTDGLYLTTLDRTDCKQLSVIEQIVIKYHSLSILMLLSRDMSWESTRGTEVSVDDRYVISLIGDSVDVWMTGSLVYRNHGMRKVVDG